MFAPVLIKNRTLLLVIGDEQAILCYFADDCPLRRAT